MALHVRGVVLPEGEVRDLWLVGDRVTCEPVAGAETISDGGWILPGLVDAHCHLGIAYGAKPIESLDQARELAVTDRDAGVLALRDAGSPYPYPETRKTAAMREGVRRALPRAHSGFAFLVKACPFPVAAWLPSKDTSSRFVRPTFAEAPWRKPFSSTRCADKMSRFAR